MVNKTSLYRKKIRATLAVGMIGVGIICQVVGVLYPPNFGVSHETGRSYIPYEMRAIGILTASMGVIFLAGGVACIPTKRLTWIGKVILIMIIITISIIWIIWGISMTWIEIYVASST